MTLTTSETTAQVPLGRTFRVQRLCAPIPKRDTPLDKAHRVFGGGNYGIGKELWDALDPVFTLDYMGAAEYEFGTVPKVLHKMFESRKELVAFSYVLPKKSFKQNPARKWARDPLPFVKRDRIIYVICHVAVADAVKERISELAQDKIRVKSGSMFPEALDPVYKHRDVRGWFELDNGFFFFIDETMWKGTCELFGVEAKGGTVGKTKKRKAHK